MSTPSLIIAGGIALCTIAFSFGYAVADWQHARAEQARRDEQQTNEKETQ